MPMPEIENPVESLSGVARLDSSLDFRARFAGNRAQIEIGLQVHPELTCGGKIAPEAHRRIRCDAPALIDDGAYSGGGYSKSDGEGVDAESDRLYEIFQEDLARMDRIGWLMVRHSVFLLMVIDNFNVSGVSARPGEADSVLIADADGILPLPVAFQRFKGRAATGQIGEISRVSRTTKRRNATRWMLPKRLLGC
jgi:hypothetical protein